MRKTVARLALVALASSGVAIAVGVPGAAAPPCNPNANGVANSGQPDKGNDDHPLSCPAEVADPGVAPTPGTVETATVGVAPAPAAQAVTGQPRLAG